MGTHRGEVTVVIPTHDRLGLLPDTVRSALEGHASPLEVVVVDDGSSDGTSAWLADQAHPRLRHLRLAPARERSAARNAGLDVVETPFVLFLDDDDLLQPDGIAPLVRALERHRVAAAAAGTYVTFGSYGPGEVARRQMTAPVPVLRSVWRELLWGWNMQPGACLWRTDRVRALGGWDESISFAEDFELNLRAHPHPVAVVPDVVVRYRHHARTPSDDVLAWRREQDAKVRRTFLERLRPSQRVVGERILESKPIFDRGLAAYADGDTVTALRALTAAHRLAPGLLVSPILGPWMAGLLAKACAAALLPTGLRTRAVGAHRGRREQQLARMVER